MSNSSHNRGAVWLDLQQQSATERRRAIHRGEQTVVVSAAVYALVHGRPAATTDEEYVDVSSEFSGSAFERLLEAMIPHLQLASTENMLYGSMAWRGTTVLARVETQWTPGRDFVKEWVLDTY